MNAGGKAENGFLKPVIGDAKKGLGSDTATRVYLPTDPKQSSWRLSFPPAYFPFPQDVFTIRQTAACIPGIVQYDSTKNMQKCSAQ
jgi:hypothetical protein